MTSTLNANEVSVGNEAVVATYKSHPEAEAAVRSLAANGVPINSISIIGRNYESHEDIQGFYRPADAALIGAGQGAWFGGIFGLFMGAFGFFIFPLVGALVVLGPLAGMIAGAIGGAGVGALVSGLIAAGVPRNEALKYEERLQAGEFLIVVHGSASAASKAADILRNTPTLDIQTHRSSGNSVGLNDGNTRL